MTARAPFVAALGCTLAMFVFAEADACSRPYRNAFADYGKPPAADLMRTARYIDWVEVVASDGPGCVRDRLLSEAEWKALDAAEAADPGSSHALDPPPRTSDGYVTRSCWFKDGVTPFRALRAKIVQPVRGGSAAEFPLVWAWDGRGRPGYAYSDPRVLMIESETALREQYDDAIAMHQDRGFIDHGELTEQKDFTDSCGGAPTAIVGARYLVFRSSTGAVLAMEPVADAQDPWFRRVVEFASRPEAFARVELDVSAFIGRSRGAAVVRIKQCLRNRYGDREVQAEVLRGGFDAGWLADIVSTTADENSTAIGPREDGPSFNWLADYADRIGARCRTGDEWMLFSGPFDVAGESPPRAARISAGKVRSNDLISGYRLVGPAYPTIEQVFAWVAEGRPSPSGRP